MKLSQNLQAYLDNYELELKKAADELREAIELLKKQMAGMIQKPEDWEYKAERIICAGMALDSLAIPYVFGGETRTGMDCSGFTQFLYKFGAGVTLPRVSKNQAQQGVEVDKTDLNQWRRADLIAFSYKGVEVDHIGIYIGGGKMLHTNTPATGINIKDVGPDSFGLVTVRRVF